MVNVSFFIDKQRDIKNIWDKSTKGAPYGNFSVPENFKKICSNKTLEESTPEFEKFLSKIYSSSYLEVFKNSVEELWGKIEGEFFSRIDKILKFKYKRAINVYVTTIGICPYNPRESSFMISSLYNLQKAVATCGHEIMHLYFHEFYWTSVEKEIGEEKTAHLKEALTVLLNLEFKDLWLINDEGYSEHKELREFISGEWKKEKDFENLIRKCVAYLKEN